MATRSAEVETRARLPRGALSRKVQAFLEDVCSDFRHVLEVTDWDGASYTVGRGEPHWCGEPLRMTLAEEDAGRDLLRLDGMRFLQRFLAGGVDLEGNLYALTILKNDADVELKLRHLLAKIWKIIAFQNKRRAQVSVKSHYDVPQEAINLYLDRKYMSYSCGMFEEPDRFDKKELLRVGQGERDDFDSLEKAQWRKFADAADYIAPGPDEEVLDVGCGYGGQLMVFLERHRFKKVVGWTHSANQAREGERMLAGFDPERWELHEGDYREDDRVFDHITSTGMISHVGPRGLAPYVKQVRKRIKDGGRYLHHSLMTHYTRLPIDFNVGIAFNKRYVWPGFHWFTLGEHVRALEKNGFQVDKVRNLTFHYAKTTAAWYERMMAHSEEVKAYLGESTFRAWQIFLAGITQSYLNRHTHVYRLYCVAT